MFIIGIILGAISIFILNDIIWDIIYLIATKEIEALISLGCFLIASVVVGICIGLKNAQINLKRR